MDAATDAARSGSVMIRQTLAIRIRVAPAAVLCARGARARGGASIEKKREVGACMPTPTVACVLFLLSEVGSGEHAH